MPTVSKSMKIAAAGGVAAIAAGIGASAAMADTSTPTPSGTATAAPSQTGAETGRGSGGHGGPGGHRGGPGGMDAAALATELRGHRSQGHGCPREGPCRPAAADAVGSGHQADRGRTPGSREGPCDSVGQGARCQRGEGPGRPRCDQGRPRGAAARPSCHRVWTPPSRLAPCRPPTRRRSSRRSTPAYWVAGTRRAPRPDPGHPPSAGGAGALSRPRRERGRVVEDRRDPCAAANLRYAGWRAPRHTAGWWQPRDAPSLRVCRVPRPRFGRSPSRSGTLDRLLDARR